MKLLTWTLSSALFLFLAADARAGSVQVLHAFNGADGGEPLAGLTAAGSTLYGTTAFGGANNLGTVFSMNRDGTGFQVLHEFTGAGAQPEARLTLVGSTLYGTTLDGRGTIYSMNLDGTGYQVLHAFTSISGIWPQTGLTSVGSTLYGTTSAGGANSLGTIFSMNLDGAGYQVLHSFNGSDGDNPYYSDLTAVGSTLYGTTSAGGANNRGTIFSMNLDGTGYQVLHSFNGSQGQYPHGTLTLVGSTLYGTTSGSSNGIGNGTIFSMNVDGTDFQVLHSLLGGQTISSEGGFPEAGLTLVGSTLYGTTSAGGIGGTGTIFSMNLDGTGFQIVHNFKGATEGQESYGSLALVGSTLYGTARRGGTIGSGGYGTVFSISVPEPSTFALAALGVVGLFALRKRGRSSAVRVLLLTLALAMSLADAHAVTIDTVLVGNAGNLGELSGAGAGGVGADAIVGGVSYAYRIGAYEVTNAQYAEFLNAKAVSDPLHLYNTSMGSNARGGITRSGSDGSYSYSVKPVMGDKPVNYVSWYDAIRFANWLGNGQGAADTESGAYTLGELDVSGVPIDGASITRNVGATWFLPSEDEWYKAAYYDPTLMGGGGAYWDYPTRSDLAPTLALADNTGNIINPGVNVANYNFGADWNGQDGNLTTVGGAGSSSASFYGTYDQGGNVYEWNETLIRVERDTRGGSAGVSAAGLLANHRTGDAFPTNEVLGLGFRVATVPEPSTFILAALGVVGFFALRKPRRATLVVRHFIGAAGYRDRSVLAARAGIPSRSWSKHSQSIKARPKAPAEQVRENNERSVSLENDVVLNPVPGG